MQKLFKTLTICLLVSTGALNAMEKKKQEQEPEKTSEQEQNPTRIGNLVFLATLLYEMEKQNARQKQEPEPEKTSEQKQAPTEQAENNLLFQMVWCSDPNCTIHNRQPPQSSGLATLITALNNMDLQTQNPQTHPTTSNPFSAPDTKEDTREDTSDDEN